ncbi:MAG: cyanophycin synthetase [bacterium]|nr:cyanophycin synthetase [bacterium]
MTQFQSYYRALHFLAELQRQPLVTFLNGKTLDPLVYIKRTQLLLDYVGNPERELRYVHVAGTAGKGTVTAMLHDALIAAGGKVGSLVSPHVTTPIERFRIGNDLLSPDIFASLVDELKPAIEKCTEFSGLGRPALVEVYVAIALLAFARAGCRWAIVEVGCGGRYDPTNVIPNHDIGVVTNIGVDHQRILGSSYDSIARQKIGIAKRGCTVITAEQNGHLVDLFGEHCEAVGAELLAIERGDDMNISLARAVLEKLEINHPAIEPAMMATKLPGRCEVMQENPLVILDGAHNPMKIDRLAQFLKESGYGPVHCVFAACANKDARTMIRLLEPHVTRWYFTRFIAGRRAFQPEALAAFATTPATIYADPHVALATARVNAGERGTIVIAGSFFLAGELRKEWISEEDILGGRSSFPLVTAPVVEREMIAELA